MASAKRTRNSKTMSASKPPPADAERKLEQHRAALTALVAAFSRFTAEDELGDPFGALLQILLDFTGSRFGTISRVGLPSGEDNEPGFTVIKALPRDFEEKFLGDKRVVGGLNSLLSGGLTGYVVSTKAPAFTNDYANDPRRTNLSSRVGVLSNLLAFPVLDGENVIGIVSLGNRPGGFDDGLITEIAPFVESICILMRAVEWRFRRQAAERQLKISDDSFAAVFDDAPIGRWELDLVGKTLHWSPQTKRIFGVPDDFEPTMKGFREFVHPDDRDRVKRLSDDILESDDIGKFEFRVVRPDGEEVFLEVRGLTQRDETGKPTSVAGSVTDATERKKVGASRARTLEIFSSDALNLPQKVNQLLEVATKFLGLGSGVVTRCLGEECEVVFSYGRTKRDRLPIGLRGWTENGYAKVFGVSTSLVALREARSDKIPMEGKIGCYLGFPLFVDGERYGTLNFFDKEPRSHAFTEAEKNYVQMIGQWIAFELGRDELVQSLTRSRLALEQKSNELSLIIDSLPAIIALKDERNRVVSINRLGAEVVGKGLGEWTPVDSRDLFNPAMDVGGAESDYAATLKVLQTGKPVRGRVEHFLSPARGEGWWTVDRVPFRDVVTGRNQVLTVALDITDQKKAQLTLEKHADELRRAKEAADSANRAKSEFLAAMSHEIRTPLNAVIGLTSTLLESSLTSRQKDLVKEANRAGEHLLELINDILDISKLEAKKVTLQETPFDPWQLVRDAIGIFRQTATAKSLDLKASIGSDLPGTVMGDEARLRQVLVNLIGNAIKFTETGEVAVCASWVEQDGSSPGTEQFRVEVSDTGIGIKPADQARLFEPFSQVGRAGSQNHDGFGLGLAICKRFIDLMGGKLGVDSVLGAGSKFWFEVPLSRASRVEPAPDAAVAKSVSCRGNCSFKILVVDDNPANRLVCREILSAIGHACTDVASGQEALSVLQQGDYDIVLMDVEMPGINGIEATRRIREFEAPKRDVPILALTAHALPGDRERFLAAGMDEYLAKPITVARLDKALRVLCEKTGLTRDSNPIPRPSACDSDDGSSGLLDLAIVQDLSTVVGAERLMELLPGLLSHLINTVDAVEQACAAEDCEASRSAAHALCGAASSIGARALAELAREMEACSDDRNRFSTLSTRARDLFAESKIALDKFVSSRC